MEYKFINKAQDQRLDLFLLNSFDEDISRSQIAGWIKSGKVLVNDVAVTKAGSIVKTGAKIFLIMPEAQASELLPYDFSLEIVFEDQHLLVINKPANLTVHPGAGNHDKTLLNAVVYYLKDSSISPQTVHRLDKDTTGLMIVAKTEAARFLLSRQFQERTVSRLYYALVMVTPRAKREVQTKDSGRIETLIGRHQQYRKKMAVLEKDGRISITNWRVLEKYNYAYFIELKLETGRTHQIRVHMDYLSSPVIGDKVYGNFDVLPRELKVKADTFDRQALHAGALEFIHPVTKEKLSFKSELPKDFKELLNCFKT